MTTFRANDREMRLFNFHGKPPGSRNLFFPEDEGVSLSALQSISMGISLGQAKLFGTRPINERFKSFIPSGAGFTGLPVRAMQDRPKTNQSGFVGGRLYRSNQWRLPGNHCALTPWLMKLRYPATHLKKGKMQVVRDHSAFIMPL